MGLNLTFKGLKWLLRFIHEWSSGMLSVGIVAGHGIYQTLLL